MSKRFNNLKKILSIVSGGFVLVGGFNHIMLSRIDKLIDKLNTVQIHSLDVKDHPVLNEAYSSIVSCIDNISSIKAGNGHFFLCSGGKPGRRHCCAGEL